MDAKTAILQLLEGESTLNDKLDLLTAIEITVRSENTYQACLEVRDNLDYEDDELAKVLGE